MRVGIDLDGVLYDFQTRFRDWMRSVRKSSRNMPSAIDWYFYRSWGMSDDEFVHECNAAVAAGFLFWSGEPLSDSAEQMRRIKATGNSIHVITDRFFGPPGDAQAATGYWLSQHQIPFDSMTFTKDKTIVTVDTMLDDRLENYDQMDAAGVQVYLLDRPWNRDVGDKRRRLDTVGAYAQTILQEVAA